KDRLLKASIKVLSKLHGAFSVLAVSEEHPDEMIAFKNGPPLIVGVGEKELVVASDVQAIVSYTKNIIYLDDNEIAYLKGNQCKVFSKDGKLIDKEIVTISWDQEKAQKQGYRHFMLKEIFEQPRAVASAIEPFILHNPLSLDFSNLTFGS